MISLLAISLATTTLTISKIIRTDWSPIWRFTISSLKAIVNIIKEINTWRGRISLLLTWFLLSGTFLVILGIIIGNNALYLTGLGLWVMWLGPGTPLLLLVIALSMIIQRWVFLDRSVSMETIKKAFRNAFRKEDK